MIQRSFFAATILAVTMLSAVGCQTEPAKQATGNKGAATGSRTNPPGSPEERESTTLYAVEMVDATTAFAYGTNDLGFTGSVVIRTTDGGATWKCVLRTEQTELVGLDFIDSKTGAAISDGGVVYSTADGGETWMASNDVDLFTTRYSLESRPVAPAVRPQPGAANKNGPAPAAQVVAAEYVELLGLTFRTEKDGWAFGSREESTQGSKPGSLVTRTRPVVVRTTDGGATWQPVTLATDLPAFGMSRSSFVDATNGWVVAGTIDEDDTGAVLRTTDGGLTWKAVPLPDSKQVPQSIFFLDANNGWIVGATEDDAGDPGPSQILATRDGGATWEVKTKVASSLRAVHFIDSQNGIAVGNGGKAYRTSDGGATWTDAATHDWTGGTIIDTTDPLYKAGQPQPTYTGFALVAPGRGFATSDLGVHEYRAK